MLQVPPALPHMALGPVATLAGLRMFASVKQPTLVLPLQRPAPFGHTHEATALYP
jgi:hypothetical protein